MAIKMNIVKSDLRSYPHYLIMGSPKSGKSTLFRDIVLHQYNDPTKGLLISCGDEEGYHSLDQLQVEDVKHWDLEEDDEGNRGIIQLTDDLILNKKELGIEIVALDTLDQLVGLATKEVFEIHRRKYGKYPDSLNGALGGYNAAPKKVAELIMEQISKLNRAGYAVFVLAHTKKKDKTDVVTGETYEQLTNDLMSTFYGPVANTAQMIVNVIMELDFDDSSLQYKKVETTQSNGKKGEEVVEVRRKRAEPKRVMYFRDSGFVDAGGRFEGLPEKLPLSAENFMKAFEMGVEASRIKPVDAKTIAKQKKDEEKQIEKQSEAVKEEVKAKEKSNQEDERKSEISALIKTHMPTLGKDSLGLIKDVSTEYGIKSFADLTVVPLEALIKIERIIIESQIVDDEE